MSGAEDSDKSLCFLCIGNETHTCTDIEIKEVFKHWSNLKIDRKIFFDDYDSLFQACMTGLGVALVDSNCAIEMQESRNLIVLDGAFAVKRQAFYMLVKAIREGETAVDKFKVFIMENADLSS